MICIVKLAPDCRSPTDAIKAWIIAPDPAQAQWQVPIGEEVLSKALYRMEVSPLPGKYHLCNAADGSQYWALVA